MPPVEGAAPSGTTEGTTTVAAATQTLAAHQIISDNVEASSAFENCKKINDWNAWHCTNSKLANLYFESLDSDKMDRSVQPVIITSEKSGYYNDINSFMDHVWDGFYTGQVRLSRFPAMVEIGQDYQIEYTGTPPNKMNYKLESKDTAATEGSVFTIYYPNAGSYSVYVDNAKIPYTEWDQTLG